MTYEEAGGDPCTIFEPDSLTPAAEVTRETSFRRNCSTTGGATPRATPKATHYTYWSTVVTAAHVPAAVPIAAPLVL
jgi:hypothetical protein